MPASFCGGPAASLRIPFRFPFPSLRLLHKLSPFSQFYPMAASSRKDSFTIQTLQITDAFLVWAAFWIASLLRESFFVLMDRPLGDQESLFTMTWALYIAVPFTPLVLERFGFYERMGSKNAGSSAWQLIQGIFIIGLFISLFALFAKVEGTRRLILGLGGILMFVLLFIRERISKSYIASRRKRGLGGERVIIAGSETEIDDLLADLDADAVADWDIVERFDLAARETAELFDMLKKESVGRVIFATKDTPFDKVAQAVEVCELQGVEAWIAASFIRSQIARPVFDSVGSKPMLVLRSTPELSWELMAKEIIDKIGSFMLIVGTLPFWIVAAIGIRIASPGAPVLFSQMRAGRYGKPFRMWKFRTMVHNAEELLDQIKKEHGNQMDGPVFKLDHDPRIFPFGSLLRKLSIDELPQLLNVLMGDMSLVGPRPLPLYEVEAFCEISHRRRLSVKPGITCEWQAGGRSKITSFEDWVEMDLRYIDNWSLWLDFQIMLKTVPAVLFGKGAK
jgi:exopolysaccharide biosynthesis polyprenyl glycosylphosphotransferase